jgi:UPF0755 protein
MNSVKLRKRNFYKGAFGLTLLSKFSGTILKLILGFIMVVVIVAVGFGIYFFLEVGYRPSTSKDLVPFNINAGDSFSKVSDDLHESKLIRNTFVFRLRAKMLGAEDKIQAGYFYLRRDMTMDEILETISNARLVERQITIPEGLRLEQIATRFEEKGWNKEKFIQLVKKADYQFRFLDDKPPGASVEGYLFPDTYRIPASYTEDEIIIMMLRRFGEQYSEPLRIKAKAAGVSIFQILTMGSIIEREAVVASERPIIASVFYNRLKKDMMLQTDPTVQWARDTNNYKLNTGFSKWWDKPLLKDLDIDSPYNTYKVKGLPPGPICNPGLAALTAATEPATTDFYYFVATGDREGTHDFSRTAEEHAEKVKKYNS